jgi:hypothetical protein
MPRGRSVAAVAVVIAMLGLATPQALAAEAPSAPAQNPRLILAAATSSPLVVAPEARAFTQDTPAPAQADEPRSFFKTRTGVAALVLMVAGVAYVAVSIPNDNEKVHSPIR